MVPQTNTFAELVQGWVTQSFRTSPTFVRHRRSDGEFEASVRGDLWVRFGPPNAFYGVESRSELAFVVRERVSERALFVVTYRGDAWSGTTIITRGKSPSVKRGEVAHVPLMDGAFGQQRSQRARRLVQALDCGHRG